MQLQWRSATHLATDILDEGRRAAGQTDDHQAFLAAGVTSASASGERVPTARLMEVAALCESLSRLFPGHRIDDRLAAQIAAGEHLWDRRNWKGHLTGSAVVVDRAAGRCLMMRHKALGLELVPGGHCDPFEHLCDTALRELIEETGLSAVRLCPWHAEHGHCPIDIDTHPIPANATRREPAHFHHDFRYVFIVDEPPVAVPDEAEATWLGWRPLVVLQDRYPRVSARLPTVLR